MKGSTLSIFGIIAAALATALILCFKSITSVGVVVTAGILFVAAGIANMIFFSQRDRDKSGMGKVLTQIGNSAAIILGVCMLVFQSTFTPLVAYIFGIIIAIGALWQFFVLAIGVRPCQIPSWMYIFPLVLAGVAVYIFYVAKGGEDHKVMLPTGIGMGVLALGAICEGIAVGLWWRKGAKQSSTVAQPSISDDNEATNDEKDDKN